MRQIADRAAVRDEMHDRRIAAGVYRDPFAAQDGQQFGRALPLRKGDGAPDEVGRVLDVAAGVGQDDRRRVLENHGHGDQRAALQEAQEQRAAFVNPELGLPLENDAFRGDVRSAFEQLDGEALVAVIVLRLRGVVAGKLELVVPLELHAYRGQSRGRSRSGPEQRGGKEQPAAGATVEH